MVYHMILTIQGELEIEFDKQTIEQNEYESMLLKILKDGRYEII